MADKKEIDQLSGVDTTGHSWDGIKELNNPLPRWWLWTSLWHYRLGHWLCNRVSRASRPEWQHQGTVGLVQPR